MVGSLVLPATMVLELVRNFYVSVRNLYAASPELVKPHETVVRNLYGIQ